MIGVGTDRGESLLFEWCDVSAAGGGLVGHCGWVRCDRDAACLAGGWEVEGGVVGAGVVDFGGAAGGAHALGGFGPGGWGGVVLGPVHQARFIAPVTEFRHGFEMRAAGDVGAHGALVGPEGHGPEGEFAIGEERATAETRHTLALAQGP